MQNKIIFFLIFSLPIFGQINTSVANFFYAESDELFLDADINTSFIAVLSNKYLRVFAILHKYKNQREIMLVDTKKIDKWIGLDIINYNIFLKGDNKLKVLRINQSKIEEIKEINENIKKVTHFTDTYYLFGDGRIIILNDFFNKKDEIELEKNQKFLMANANMAAYEAKDNYINLYEILNNNLKSSINLKNEEIIFFESPKNYWIKEDIDLLKEIINSKNRNKIKIYKDLKNFIKFEKKNLVEFKLKKMLISQDNYLYIIGKMVFDDGTAKNCTLIYYKESESYNICNISSKYEGLSFDFEVNQFGDLLFLWKNMVIHIPSSSSLYKCDAY